MTNWLKLKRNKFIALVWLIMVLYINVYGQDSLLINYFNKSIVTIGRDSMDTLDLRVLTFELVNSKVVASNYNDMLKIIGPAMHVYKKNNGEKAAFYPILPLFRKFKGGSDLFVFFLDKEDKIIENSGHVYFIENDDDFYYWIDTNLPFESIEGGIGVPPNFKE